MQETKRDQNKLKVYLSITIGALFLLFSAFVNGFPIVYADTSTYLASGFELQTPIDRPIIYGLFLRLFSLNGSSLWLVILAQAILLSFLIFKLTKVCLAKHVDNNIIFISIMAFLSLLTSASWTTSQLIADIFAPIMVLSMLILVIEPSIKKSQFSLYAIFLLATATHLSHITFNVLFILSILTIRQVKFFNIKESIGVKPLMICLTLTILSISTMGSALSKSKHGFLMGAMVEHGIAKKYLDENCDNIDFAFCNYKDSLPKKGYIFLWNEKSPFYKMGGWKGTKAEFNEIIFNTLTQPRYILLHIQESLKASIDQLTKFKIGDGNGVFLDNTMVYKRVNKYASHEIDQFESSLQNQNKLDFLVWYNMVLWFIILISVVLLIWITIKLFRADKQFLAVITFIILAVLINAWTCGTFANAIDRLGSKIMWFFPLITTIGLVKIWLIYSTIPQN